METYEIILCILGVIAGIALILGLIGFIIFNICSKRRYPYKDMGERIEIPDDMAEQFPKLSKSIKLRRLQARDGLKLSAYWYDAEQSHKWCILIHGWHGNAGTMIYFMDHMISRGYNCIAPDMRACGRSEGRYSTLGATDKEDILLWIDEILKADKDASILLYGASMGGLISLLTGCTNHDRINAIITDSAPCSFKEMICRIVKGTLRVLPYLFVAIAAFFMKIIAKFNLNDTDAMAVLPSLRKPILLIHGKEDGMVPCEMMDQMYSVILSYKERLLVEGADHVKSVGTDTEKYWQTVDGFLDKVESGMTDRICD